MSETEYYTIDQEKALKKMREPFPPNQVSTFCKPTSRDGQPGNCKDCGKRHKLPSFQISYVGHAALTDRLLDADPNWCWVPLSYAADGTPFIDKDGGMWIKLTVAGVTRLGYGDAQGKMGGDAMKERIGDALRNAAMRFGAALELWHKGELHVEEEEKEEETKAPVQLEGVLSQQAPTNGNGKGRKMLDLQEWLDEINGCLTVGEFKVTGEGSGLMLAYGKSWRIAKALNDRDACRKLSEAYKKRRAELAVQNGEVIP